MIDPRSTKAYKLEKENRELRNEIERLNNIIKTLGKYVIDVQISEYGDTLKEAEEYLERLKAGDKE